MTWKKGDVAFYKGPLSDECKNSHNECTCHGLLRIKKVLDKEYSEQDHTISGVWISCDKGHDMFHPDELEKPFWLDGNEKKVGKSVPTILEPGYVPLDVPEVTVVG